MAATSWLPCCRTANKCPAAVTAQAVCKNYAIGPKLPTLRWQNSGKNMNCLIAVVRAYVPWRSAACPGLGDHDIFAHHIALIAAMQCRLRFGSQAALHRRDIIAAQQPQGLLGNATENERITEGGSGAFFRPLPPLGRPGMTELWGRTPE
jgi:hypothetical protein